MIPAELIEACERNDFMWHRENPDDIDHAFDKLGLNKSGEFFAFCRKYCLQFISSTLPFELVDFVEDDGEILDSVDYAHAELGIARDFIPLSSFFASSVYGVFPNDDRVVLLTPSDEDESWNEEILSPSFFKFMSAHL